MILKVVLVSVISMFGFNGCATGELERQMTTSTTRSSVQNNSSNRPIKENVYYKSAIVRHSGVGNFSAREDTLMLQKLKSIGKDTPRAYKYNEQLRKVENMKKYCLTTSNTWVNPQGRIKMNFLDEKNEKVHENWFNASELREESPDMQKLCQQRYSKIYKVIDQREAMYKRGLGKLMENHREKCLRGELPFDSCYGYTSSGKLYRKF